MSLIRLIIISALLAPHIFAAPKTEASLKTLTLSELETLLTDNDRELETLSKYSLRNGVGTKGYRSEGHTAPDQTEWIEIDLGGVYDIDQIALVPSILRDTKRGFVDEGFPKEFQIIAGLSGDDKGTVVASFGAEDNLQPRIAPVVSAFPTISADWVRIEATKLTPRGFEGKFFLQLAEIFIFSGDENVALRKPIKSSSQDGNDPSILGVSWRPEFAVDGFVPYLMDAEEGQQSLAFVGDPIERPTFTIDLGTTIPINRIHFHTIEQSTTVPLTRVGDYGQPKRFTIQGGNNADLSDSSTLIDFTRVKIKDTGPLLQLQFPEKFCRYIHITLEPEIVYTAEDHQRLSVVGFAEIELFSRGRNVLVGNLIQTNLVPTHPLRSVATLTDGLNFFGRILPIRDWIDELARRHDLEVARPLIVAELNERYARQKTNLQLTYRLLALLGGFIIAIILISRIIRLRQIASIKERLAADLHDELGADLHTIGLLSDLAEESKHSPEKLAMLHKRIRNVTTESGVAVRHCTNMLDAASSKLNIKDNIYQASRRIMAKLDNSISIEGEEYLNKLKAKTRFDLCLFYNECLVNISRHSGASKFATQLRADKHSVLLTISDNGMGLSISADSGVPKSLKRRARLLGAKVSLETPESGGTHIKLKLKTRKWGFRK